MPLTAIKRPQFFWGLKDGKKGTVFAANLDIDTAEDWLRGINNPKVKLFHHKLKYVFTRKRKRTKSTP